MGFLLGNQIFGVDLLIIWLLANLPVASMRKMEPVVLTFFSCL